MKQFTLRLDATQQRPVVLLKNLLTALLNTGAYIPIWTGKIWSGISESLIVKAVYILCAINSNNPHPYITAQVAINSK